MRYLDTGSRLASETLAAWFEPVLNEEIVELRLQTGFFSLGGMGLLVPTFNRSVQKNLPTKILIGSNDGDTLRDDMAGLVQLLGIPRNGAQLGVISFGNGYFHPKTYYVRRSDGSEAAYVGSANLTASGLACHVEAGITLDTREGDDPRLLSQIAAAIEAWFAEKRQGLTLVAGTHTLDELVASGVLALARPPRTASVSGEGSGGGRAAPPRLQRLITLPSVQIKQNPIALPATAAQPTVPPIPPAAPVTNIHSVRKPGLPKYFLFDPTATSPTSGTNALSGTQLPGGVNGIVIKLTKDSARHFAGKTGTANITLPVDTVETLRFGVGGNWSRPWAEVNLRARYIGNGGTISSTLTPASVQAYGYISGETSSQNIRLGVLTPATSNIVQQTASNGWKAPVPGDLALLEWPVLANPIFLLTFMEKPSALYANAEALMLAATSAGQLVGKSACWLPPGLSPAW
ncbi:hypothetical protein [Nitrosovibrio sp. Nv6]|uniref:hypothetical protein n=1 Tax=Nitrosovibrio sp. Nv6 TaxID=1855340 RepID=UPI0008C096B9|nr:hypothetical protein [Nitrosovibrio sp. Nv6]SEP42514.1 PLD-like domain-containing protein [Nitrosovibrio sp. Nv6]